MRVGYVSDILASYLICVQQEYPYSLFLVAAERIRCCQHWGCRKSIHIAPQNCSTEAATRHACLSQVIWTILCCASLRCVKIFNLTCVWLWPQRKGKFAAIRSNAKCVIKFTIVRTFHKNLQYILNVVPKLPHFQTELRCYTFKQRTQDHKNQFRYLHIENVSHFVGFMSPVARSTIGPTSRDGSDCNSVSLVE